MRELKERVFRGWPLSPGPLRVEETLHAVRGDLRLRAYEFNSEPGARLRLFSVQRAEQGDPERLELRVADDDGWPAWRTWLQAQLGAQWADASGDGKNSGAETNITIPQRLLQESLARKEALVIFAPRGVETGEGHGNDRAAVHRLRRYMLLGQTRESMRVWDIRRALQAIRETPRFQSARLTLSASRHAAVNGVYAALFEPGIEGLRLDELPASHRLGPDYLNVLRVLDVPMAVALAAEKIPIEFNECARAGWEYSELVATRLGWPADRLVQKLKAP